MARLSDASKKRSVATRGGSWVLFALLFASSLAAAERNDDAEHLLFSGEHGLTVIRLRIEIDGTPHRKLCRSSLETICTEADRDQDGSLTTEEYDAGVANHPVLIDRQNRMMRRPNGKPDRPDFGSTGKRPIAAVTEFLLRIVWPPLSLEFATPAMRQINEAGELLDRPFADSQLFERLDTDGNRKLTSREVERAVDILFKLDFDEDETISLDELRTQSAPNALPAANPNRPARQGDSHLSHLSPERIDATFVRRILSLYDGEAKDSVKDLRLDRREAGVAEAVFTPADADQDGYWDFDELWRYLERPVPSAEISLKLFSDTRLPALRLSFDDASAFRLIHEHPSALEFDVHGTRFQWLIPPGESSPWAKNTLELEFELLDGDKNQYLEPKEWIASNEDDPSGKTQFMQIDADGDDKITRDEFRVYHLKSLVYRDRQLELNVENLGRTLFGPLDTNSDGRLSKRELAALKTRASEWDADGDHKLTEQEIPRQYRLSLRRRSVLRIGNVASEFATGGANGVTSAEASGPLWFRKMDRNRDGEVSAREFLGPVDLFQKIDANADAAIDAAEAAKVK